MAETAALFCDEVLPERPLRQWVLSLPYALRFLLATDPDSPTLVLRTGYRVAVGPRAGQKLFTLQTVPARAEEPEQQGDSRGAANAGGFSLHAGLDIQPHQREKLERLCRYVSRPAVAVERLALISSGQVRYQLKTAYRDGTTHIVLRATGSDGAACRTGATPADAPEEISWGIRATQQAQGCGDAGASGYRKQEQGADQADLDIPATARPVAISWAQRLKRVFGVDNTCARCGGKLKVIASIEEPEVIAKILAHLEKAAPDQSRAELPLGARARRPRHD